MSCFQKDLYFCNLMWEWEEHPVYLIQLTILRRYLTDFLSVISKLFHLRYILQSNNKEKSLLVSY